MGNLTAMIWKDKGNVNMLTNIHPPAEGNFCDEHGNTLKPAIDLTILNSFILLNSCRAKLSHRDFKLA
jgi:hypothetical protein